jgi:hypothetical protein
MEDKSRNNKIRINIFDPEGKKKKSEELGEYSVTWILIPPNIKQSQCRSSKIPMGYQKVEGF